MGQRSTRLGRAFQNEATKIVHLSERDKWVNIILVVEYRDSSREIRSTHKKLQDFVSLLGRFVEIFEHVESVFVGNPPRDAPKKWRQLRHTGKAEDKN